MITCEKLIFNGRVYMMKIVKIVSVVIIVLAVLLIALGSCGDPEVAEEPEQVEEISTPEQLVFSVLDETTNHDDYPDPVININ
jgi:hypothetical protein